MEEDLRFLHLSRKNKVTYTIERIRDEKSSRFYFVIPVLITVVEEERERRSFINNL